MRRILLEEVFVNADGPLSFVEIKAHFQDAHRSALAAYLSHLHRRGVLKREGRPRHYLYSLTDEAKADLQPDEAKADLQREKRIVDRRLNKRSVARSIRVAREPRTGEWSKALQPYWPAVQTKITNANLAPVLGLPWEGEEELPPVIGERYADVMLGIGQE